MERMTEDRQLQAAVLDLGGVVIEVSLEAIARHWARAAELAAADVLAAMRADTRYQPFERGEITTQEFYEHVVGLLGRRISFEDFDRGFNRIYLGLTAGIEPLLARLSKRLRLVALTNTNACHAAVWPQRFAGALTHFERVFMSHEMGVRKPEPAAYERVLAYLAAPPERVVFVDDDASNVRAAEALGMKGIVAAGTDPLTRDLRRMGVSV